MSSFIRFSDVIGAILLRILPLRTPCEDGGGIDANVEYCSVIKTKLGAHRIIMGAEMDCCDATDDGRRFYVELKTSREVCFA